MTARPIDILGAGAFGTALAIAYARAGRDVRLWARDRAEAMQIARENRHRLPGHRFPDRLTITDDRATLRADLLLLAVPTQSLDTVLTEFQPAAAHVVSCAKGLHFDTGLFPTALIARHCPNAVAAQLTGPSFAQDIARGLPTALTLACADDPAAQALQHALHTPSIRPYRTTDVVGAEIGGALKNIYAIACGACIGEGMGDSTRAALMTRGFAEMTRFAIASGARAETLTGLSGLGDLALTCGSEMSRNYRFGLALGRREPFTDPATVEGVVTAQAVVTRAAKIGVDMPIAAEVVSMLSGTYSIAEAINSLIDRRLKSEDPPCSSL